MKLALIRQRYNPFGGAERFVEQALRSLDTRGGLSLTLIARDWREGSVDRWAEVVHCDPFYAGRTWRDWSFARAACDAARRGGFDLVQSHERIACCDIYRAGDGVHVQWLENRARTLGPIRRLAQAVSPWHRYTLAAERRLFASPRLRAIICNSAMVADEVRRHFGVDASRLRVIHNGVDLARFHPELRGKWRNAMRRRLKLSEDAMVFLFLGSGFERKGVACLLDAFAAVAAQRPQTRLVVVGADRHLSRFRARSRALGLGQRVQFTGPHEDAAPWYAMADAFVLPTLYDPFPNAVLEAMASGLPVLTSEQCGAAELITPGKNGWVLDALDSAALSRRLAALDSPTSERMGMAARVVAEGYPLSSVSDKLLNLYAELLGGAARG
jgi:UDP-glucose:(heptosyl)LPS alpha-1,3-glucosyltransferase